MWKAGFMFKIAHDDEKGRNGLKYNRDLHSVRESNVRLFALKLNIGFFLEIGGVAYSSHTSLSV
jgi:hypothetical protein